MRIHSFRRRGALMLLVFAQVALAADDDLPCLIASLRKLRCNITVCGLLGIMLRNAWILRASSEDDRKQELIKSVPLVLQ